ncbi:MAG: Gfo/Idh/MocA family oxidoreductase [Bacillota bacterium]|nr:Gfo/Idh/MocA family oxidoreductase [Bacillota bacterium]
MKDKIGWGFIGAGHISHRFIKGLLEVPDAYLAAVGSRAEGKAEAFVSQYGGKAYTSYEKVILDKDVDIIYVATPNSLHMEHTLLSLDLGKPVLCEKPMAANAAQARAMASKAREKRLFLMEAMWTRFFPAMEKVRSWINDREIGNIHYLTAEFGFNKGAEDPKSRLFDPALAGGSLLDLGVYAVSFSSMVFGKKPRYIASIAEPASTGVDAHMGCLLGYEGGGIASLFSSLHTNSAREARISGERGYIVIPKFWMPVNAILYKDQQFAEEFSCESASEGFQYEIAAVQKDLRGGRTEDPLMPLDESIAILETMDALRAQWGLVYPFEK